MATERLQKYIASAGVVSRRKAEELITAGRVFVNGAKVKKLGTSVDPQHDEVTVDGYVVEPATSFRYIALNKPTGVVCTRAQYKGERTVYGLVPDARDLVIAGRLDKDSDGLVIMTNDGELINQLTHPRYQHTKEYTIATAKPLTPEAIQQLRDGIKLTEGIAVFDSITEIGPSHYRVVMHQGWKRQIRRMISEVHNHVARLTRTRLGKLELGALQLSSWRKVSREDIL